MKSSLKILASLVALGAIGSLPLLRAADEIQTPLPAAPDAPPPPRDHEGKGDRPMRGGRGAEMVKMLKEKLSLTDDQVKKVEDIMKSHADDLRAARGDRAKMGEIMKTQHDEIRAILTPDQQKQFDQMPPPGRRGGKNRDGGDTPPPPPPPRPAT